MAASSGAAAAGARSEAPPHAAINPDSPRIARPSFAFFIMRITFLLAH